MCVRQNGLPEDGGWCFICLDDESVGPLLPCCTQCFALTHQTCWRDYRDNQQLTNLRARILGIGRPDPLNCTICRTGLAYLGGETSSLSEFGGVSDPQPLLMERLVHVIGEIGHQSLDEDSDHPNDPPYFSHPLYFSVLFCILFGLVGFVILCFFMGMYPSYAVLLSIFWTYVGCVLCFILFAYKQRSAALRDYLIWIQRWDESSDAFVREEPPSGELNDGEEMIEMGEINESTETSIQLT